MENTKGYSSFRVLKRLIEMRSSNTSRYLYLPDSPKLFAPRFYLTFHKEYSLSIVYRMVEGLGVDSYQYIHS